MSGKLKTSDPELMDAGMSGNLTPAKRGSEPENDTIQPEKQPKLTTHEKPPIETFQQLIDVPGNEVEPPRAIGGYCRIHDCNADDHTTFTCPDKEKYFVHVGGAYILNCCAACGLGHLGIDCPHYADDLC